jgi:hypothetical protein
MFPILVYTFRSVVFISTISSCIFYISSDKPFSAAFALFSSCFTSSENPAIIEAPSSEFCIESKKSDIS